MFERWELCFKFLNWWIGLIRCLAYPDMLFRNIIYGCYCVYVDCFMTYVMPRHLVGPSPQVDDPRTPGSLGLRIAGHHKWALDSSDWSNYPQIPRVLTILYCFWGQNWAISGIRKPVHAFS